MNKLTPNYSRRKILKMGVLTATAAYAYSVSGISLMGKSWALTVTSLSQATATSLLQVCRSIYPHPQLEDLFYAASVESIDSSIANNPEMRKALEDGISALIKAAGGDWTSINAAKQTELLQHVASEPFFQAIRGNMVVSFYDNPNIWPKFGYEGPSFSKGGYLHRGFDDIDWLPEANKES